MHELHTFSSCQSVNETDDGKHARDGPNDAGNANGRNERQNDGDDGAL